MFLWERNCEKLVAEEVSFAFTYSVSSLIRYEAFFNRFLHLPLFYFSPNRPYPRIYEKNKEKRKHRERFKVSTKYHFGIVNIPLGKIYFNRGYFLSPCSS